MTLIENETVSLEFQSEDGDDSVGTSEDQYSDCSGHEDEELVRDGSREEYDRLIRDRFKEHFAADTQRLINRRFKKYRALEEKVKKLEEDAARYADIDRLISDERDRAVRETEERMNRQFRADHARAEENALSPRSSMPQFDVSRLTKSERASLASRAQKGEKISFK